MAAILEIGRENFGPIASPSRYDLDNIGLGLHAEKCENFQRMTVAVTRLVGVAPLGAVDERGKRGVRRLPRCIQGQANA